MRLDFPGLHQALPDDPRGSFSNAAIYAIPEVVERSKRVAARPIDRAPYRVLDAPGLMDDFYLNLLDWNGPVISIGLGECVYTYNVDTKEVNELFSVAGGYVSSLVGLDGGLAVGDSTGALTLLDYEKGVCGGSKQHTVRICAAAASDRLISTGDRAGRIVNIDRRSGVAGTFSGHTQEICGLKWCNDHLASGSNDDTVRVWRAGSPVPRILKGHGSAVKALAWCPWRSNVLATGGGTKDKSIKLWDTNDGMCLKTVAVDSQVCSLLYLSRYKELVSSHGFSENDLRLWRVSGMKMQMSFGSHEGRVLHTALSPDQCSIVSLGADESLKFWKIADRPALVTKRDSIGMR
ncbi:cell division cycle 20, cofactor of APC complex [Pancytospora philotis]|nr:cell division cycle 20, cofactor of APC complex [Pancytospora philotis]